jgi:hypothetical protein
MVFDPKKLLKNKTPEQIEAIAIIGNQKHADQIKEIYAQFPPGTARDLEIARLLSPDQSYCDIVPCLKSGTQIRVDWKSLKNDPRILDSMKDNGYVVLPKNAVAKTP